MRNRPRRKAERFIEFLNGRVVVFMAQSSRKISPFWQGKSAPSANRSIQLHKRRQLFIGTHTEALTVATCVNNEDPPPPMGRSTVATVGETGFELLGKIEA
jgi:hypothetical protein